MSGYVNVTRGYGNFNGMGGGSSPIPNPKAPVKATPISNVNISNPGTSIFDGYTASNGDRILLQAQTLLRQNGIYVFNGSASAMTRSSDADLWTSLINATTYVQEGSINQGTTWQSNIMSTGIIDVDPITWILINNSTLPIGSMTQLGILQVGSYINVSSGVISLPQSIAVSANPAFNSLNITNQGTFADINITGITGATSASRYVGATNSGAPVAGTFNVGDFVIDRTGIQWFCIIAGSPGTWKTLTVFGRSGPTINAVADDYNSVFYFQTTSQIIEGDSPTVGVQLQIRSKSDTSKILYIGTETSGTPYGFITSQAFGVGSELKLNTAISPVSIGLLSVNAQSSLDIYADLSLGVITTPSTPRSNTGKLYPKSDGDFYFLNAANTEYNITTRFPLFAKVIAQSDNNASSDMQYVAKGLTTATKQAWFGIDTTDNVGVLLAVNVGISNLPVMVNPYGGNIGFGHALNHTFVDPYEFNSMVGINGYLFLSTQTPPSPPTGGMRIYPKSDGLLYAKNEAGTEYDLTASGSVSPLTTKGDLYTYSTLNARLPVGSNGQLLTADSPQATGLLWSSVVTLNITTTPIPPVGANKIYSKSDNETYSIAPSGIEIPLTYAKMRSSTTVDTNGQADSVVGLDSSSGANLFVVDVANLKRPLTIIWSQGISMPQFQAAAGQTIDGSSSAFTFTTIRSNVTIVPNPGVANSMVVTALRGTVI